jgi:hypothetical protein
MAHLDDNSVLDRGTTFCVGSRIFIADGSGGFNSRPIDQNTSEASEATRRQEIDNFADQLEEVGLSVSNNGTQTQPEFDTISPKTLSELEKDLDKFLEITKQETTVDRKIISYGCQQDINQEEQPVNIVSPTFKDYLKYLMKIRRPRVDNSELLNGIDQVSKSIEGCINLAESSLRKQKSRVSFKITTRKKKTSEDIFSSIDHIDEKIRHCLQLAEDTLNKKKPYDRECGEFVNPWASSNSEMEHDLAFINYVDELDGPISEDELAEWPNDIDLFMEGLSNPDKLEALWKQSKAKKLWDESLLVLLKYPFYPLFILDNGMNLISKSLTVLTPA